MSDIESFQSIPTTSRNAEFLARSHGFDSLTHLTDSLPLGAQVIDVGAGASPFGKEVAKQRPDIRWVNFDFSYKDPAILIEANADAPENVEFVTGDATRLDMLYDTGTFDAVFSYWMLPHLSLYSTVPAKEAAAAMFNIAKQGARLSVGPTKGVMKNILRRPKTHVIEKELANTAEDFATDALAAIRLRGGRLVLQRVYNEAFNEVLGTTRYTKKSPKLKLNQILVPRSGKYHSFLHPASPPTIAKLEIALVKQFLKPDTYRKVTS